MATTSAAYATEACRLLAQAHHDMTQHPVIPDYDRSLAALQALQQTVHPSQLVLYAHHIYIQVEILLDLAAQDKWQPTVQVIAAAALALNIAQNALPHIK